MTGSNSLTKYQPQRLLAIAKKEGTSVIIVSIQYRLGPFGFAASNDLLTEASAINGHSLDVPLAGSYGFIDQRNAFEWVRDHISDFGGDPNNVTAFGISAGSSTIYSHLLSGSPLFDRAIMMSGAGPTLGPFPLKAHERPWQKFCKNAGAQEDNGISRVNHLRSLSAEEVIKLYPLSAMGPWADGKLLPSSLRYAHKYIPNRCKTIILGDTHVEGIIFDRISQVVSQVQFSNLVDEIFAPEDGEAFRKYFGFTSVELPQDSYRDALRRFLGIMMFQFPNLGVAKSFTGDAHYYHFEEPSPYPGPTFGLAYHGQCAMYMYNSESHTYSEGGRRIAEELARLWTGFAYGKRPWEPYLKAEGFMRFGPEGEIVMTDMKHDKTRDYGYVTWLEQHFEEVKEFTLRLFG